MVPVDSKSMTEGIKKFINEVIFYRSEWRKSRVNTEHFIDLRGCNFFFCVLIY